MSTAAANEPVVSTGGATQRFVSELHQTVRSVQEASAPPALDPLYRAAVDAVEDGCLILALDPYGLRTETQAAPGLGAEIVPWLFRLFDEGVRQLVILPGVTRDELADFVRVVGTPPPPGDTRVGLAWSRRLLHVRLRVATLRPMDLRVEDGGRIRSGASVERVEDGAGLADECDVCRVPGGATPEAPEDITPLRDAFSGELAPERLLALALALPEGGSAPVVLATLEHRLWDQDPDRVADLLERAIETDRSEAESLAAALLEPERVRSLARVLAKDRGRLRTLLIGLLPAVTPGVEELTVALVDPTTRSGWIRALVEAGHDVGPLYRRQLASDDIADALEAISGLAASVGPASLVALADALAHPVEVVREASLAALVGCWDPALRVPVGRALRDESPAVRLGALALLEGAGDDQTVGALLALAGSEAFRDWEGDDRSRVWRLLVALGTRRVEEALRTLLAKPSLLAGGVAQDQLAVLEALNTSDAAWCAQMRASARARWVHAPAVRQALRALS